MDVAEAPAAEESLLARLVAAVDIRGVGSLTRAELGEAARLRGPSSKNLDLAAAGPEPYALADAARLLRPLGWEAARLEEDVAKVERSAAVFRALDASQSGFLELKELRAALTAQAGHALRLAGLALRRTVRVVRDWALETAPLHIFSDIDIDVGVGDEALKELSFLERLPCYVVQATFRKQARRKLLYAGKRGISLFLLKLLLKKVVARVFLKGLARDLALVVAVNALWNLLMVAGCVRSAKVCCFGLPAATGAIHAAIDRRETRARTPLDLARRLAAGSAARPPELVDDGASRGARDHARLAVMELDDENRFFAGLAAAEPASADLALELFAAMLVLDGRVARGTRGGNARRMGRVLEVAGRHVPRNDVARALRHCVAVFTSGLGLCARDLVLAAGADAAGLPRCEAAEPRTADALLGYLAVDYCC
ncbi:hypothetical protein JL722_13466 [Aureococcus anophagefferens]|nr:hypothetical protein JL722_13466 [Aureococcus anophagefferens]